jgi:ABC-type nitrate/sulfonate/bicarbonate transport system ATPase subunit
LLDEPLSALDRSLRERLATDLRHVLTETGTTAMMVTHDHGDAFTVADRTAIMRAGRLVQQGARRPRSGRTPSMPTPPTSSASLSPRASRSPELKPLRGDNRAERRAWND